MRQGRPFSLVLLSAFFFLICRTSQAAGGACPTGANYLNPATGAQVTLSSLGVTSCYYIAANGSDTNTGTTETSPWLHAPGMTNCVSNCAAVTPISGEGFIFRGGDTWHFNAGAGTPVGVPWNWNWSGSVGNPIYIGVDQTWYSGTSWSRPILTGDNPITTSPVSSCSYDESTASFVNLNNPNVTFDNFEMKGLCWHGNQSRANENICCAQYLGKGQPANPVNINIENIYIHGWSHVTFNCSLNGGEPTGNCDGGQGITGDSHSNGGQGNVIANVVVDGSDSDPLSFAAVLWDCYDVHNSVIRYNANGFVCNNMYAFHDNLIEDISESSDGVSHSNGFEFNSEWPGTNTVYNNLVRHITAAVTGWVNPSQVDYQFNNVVYDILQEPWNVDPTGGGTALYFDNNTISGSGGQIGDTSASWEGILKNNLFIDSGAGGTPTSNTNVINWTSAQATAAGYTAANNYAPTSSNCNGTSPCPVGSGANLSGSCGAAGGAFCSDTTNACTYNVMNHSVTCPARAAVARPASIPWDIGAYQHLSGSGGCDGAGNCYIYASATGSGTGANWTNAYTGFGTGAHQINPAAMTRGVIYWIAAGNYGGVNFSTPDSGTSVITLEGATIANHGPAGDWNNSYAGQALFGESSVSSDYWIFNGQTRGSDWQSGYMLKFWNQSDASGAAVYIGGNSHLTFQYVEMEGTGAGFPNNTATSDRCGTDNCGVWADNAIYETAPASNLYVGYGYEHHTGNTQFQMNVTGAGGSVNNDTTWEYNWISYNHTGQNGQHDEAYSLYGSNVIIRYNVFQDICGSGLITTAGAGQPSLSNWDVYGNLFFWDSTYAALNGQYSLATIDNAVLDFLGESMSGYIHFYNNTMEGFYNAVTDANDSAFSTLAISGVSGSGGSIGSPTVQIYNNLWYGSAYATGDYSPYCSVVTGATCTQDYDAFYQGGVPSGDFHNPTETHAQTVTGNANPFINSGVGTIAGFALQAATSAGIALPAPYNIDMLGNTRGADGVWDRGAYEYCSGGNCLQAPPPPICGDGICNGGETCSSCPSDCGACPAPPTGGTGITVSNLSAVQVYPNPWRSDKHAGKSVTFANLPTNTSVKIFTVSGHLAKDLGMANGSVTWDLTNDSGDKVASGVYLYLITDSQGDKARGKLAIIR